MSQKNKAQLLQQLFANQKLNFVVFMLCIFHSACTRENAFVETEPLNAKMQKTNLVATQQRIAGLTDDNIRTYLHYYSPVIFKQAHESNEHKGYDWITNFDFDHDGYLANNKENWEKELIKYVSNAQHADWQIRPTLYSSAIVFHDNSLQTNSIILIYHVYHAMQRFEIHDWERIEIRIDNITSTPGNGEQINYVVITRHSLHNAREYPHEDLNFMTTSSGKHVMIWQADWDFSVFNPAQAELHFVEESWNNIKAMKEKNETAKVDINDYDKTRFHYIFVDGADAEATAYWNAQTITSANAATMAAAKEQSENSSMAEVKRVQYELQDLADILPTHLNTANWKDALPLNIVTPVVNEQGNIEIAAGIQTFYHTVVNIQNANEDRSGYVRKHWFWGVYIYAIEGDSFYEELGPQPWYQHLYFAHNGTRGDGSVSDELANRGIFLGKGEYSNWNTTDGGFDGRWVQLFQD